MRKLTVDIKELFPITRVRVGVDMAAPGSSDETVVRLEVADGPVMMVAKLGEGYTFSRPVTIREISAISKLLEGIA